MIRRSLEQSLLENLKQGHVTALFGARRTGKTVLMQRIAEILSDKKILTVNGEDLDAATILSSQKQSVLSNLVAGYDYLFIDEAQSVPNIGLNLKLLVDTNPGLSVFVTGSSSFDLRNQIGEPLTGRSRYWSIFPFTVSEISHDYLALMRLLPSLLVFGSYPQVYTAENDKEKRIFFK